LATATMPWAASGAIAARAAAKCWSNCGMLRGQ
nr:hypothetical protein [Tanacetum cinerariifolium]